VTTNYRPRVDEVDHGTWRSLALVCFRLNHERLGEGPQDQHEAVLNWIGTPLLGPSATQIRARVEQLIQELLGEVARVSGS
jgi:hypothetical protein